MPSLMLKGRAKWLRDLPSRVAFDVLNEPRVRLWLGQRHAAALDRHTRSLPAVDATGIRIVDVLERQGVCVTSLDALGISGSDALVDTAWPLARDFAARAQAKSRAGQQFIIVPPADIVRNPQIFLWGLNDRLLDIAERYIGLPVAYDGVAINYTVADGQAIATRQWHRDREDRRMLKVAVYLHDVDAEGGPFECITLPDTVRGDDEGYRYEFGDEASLRERLGADFSRDLTSCTGLKGTVVFCDTARFFHRGKPATARDRAALFYSYFANPPRHPFLCERSGISRAEVRRMVRGLPDRQRRAALWPQNLPPVLRLIPPQSL
ncbi:phytanoyl-CoA dioxygenase family protein [Novosphingobium gossypii]|uniref:hypothetical protein n=1 Tax=Novosphingobium gossypii TaxID=1604774 RepID=UPI003D22F641